MQREILFRGQTRRFGEKVNITSGEPMESNWVYGGIFPNNDGGDFAIIYQQEPDIKKFSVYADTVGQYTGLTDKNGVKIFEGDILKMSSDYYGYSMFREVEISKGNTYASNYGFAQNLYTEFMSSIHWDVEVIGNIHDNPELIKE